MSLTRAELLSARDLVVSVWAALAADDDAGLLALYYPPSLGLQYPAGPPPAIAADLRERMGVTVEECALMGVTMTARILPDGSGGDAVAFIGVRTLGFAIHYEQPTQVLSFTVMAYRRTPNSPWLIWGCVEQAELDAAESVAINEMPSDG